MIARTCTSIATAMLMTAALPAAAVAQVDRSRAALPRTNVAVARQVGPDRCEGEADRFGRAVADLVGADSAQAARLIRSAGDALRDYVRCTGTGPYNPSQPLPSGVMYKEASSDGEACEVAANLVMTGGASLGVLGSRDRRSQGGLRQVHRSTARRSQRVSTDLRVPSRKREIATVPRITARELRCRSVPPHSVAGRLGASALGPDDRGLVVARRRRQQLDADVRRALPARHDLLRRRACRARC
jgi:hypothetical protein